MRRRMGAGLLAAVLMLVAFGTGSGCSRTRGKDVPASNSQTPEASAPVGSQRPTGEQPRSAAGSAAEDSAWDYDGPLTEAAVNDALVEFWLPSTVSSEADFTWALDGRQEYELKAVLNDDRIGLPVQALSKLGVQWEWQAADGTVTFFRGQERVVFTLGSDRVLIAQHDVQAEFRPGVRQGRLVLPIGPLLETLGINAEWRPEGPALNLWRVKPNPLRMSTKWDKQDSDVFTLDVQYPVFTGPYGQALDRVSQHFAKWAVRLRKDALESAGFPPPRAALYSFYGQYHLTYNQNDLLSVLTFESQDTGAMHPLSSLDGLTVDLTTGTRLQLADLFRPDANYLSLVSLEIKRQIRERGLESSLERPFESIRPDQGFYLSGRDLIIYFNLYEYFPYVEGIQGFSIPMTSLQGVLAPRFAEIRWELPMVVFGDRPIPAGFPVRSLIEENPEGWGPWLSDANRVVWGPAEGDRGVWVILGARKGSRRTPRLVGLAEEAGVPVLKAALEEASDGSEVPPLLAVTPTTNTNVHAMRLRLGTEEPGVWLGYVPGSLGRDIKAPANEEDPLAVASAWSERLGFSRDAVLRFERYTHHDPSGLENAIIRVTDRGEEFTVRLYQERGEKRWRIWSVYLGYGEKLSPWFMED